MTTKKRNPTDSTLRNVRAAAKRIAALEERVAKLEAKVRRLSTSQREFSQHPSVLKVGSR